MSPAKRSKPKKAVRPAKKAPKAKAASKPKAKAVAKSSKPAKHHCAATDPFGDPCQSVPRFPSKYCTMHSYLDR